MHIVFDIYTSVNQPQMPNAIFLRYKNFSNTKKPLGAPSGFFIYLMAEREGFEPSKPFDLHTFQACSFDHSDTSPFDVLRHRSGAYTNHLMVRLQPLTYGYTKHASLQLTAACSALRPSAQYNLRVQEQQADEALLLEYRGR